MRGEVGMKNAAPDFANDIARTLDRVGSTGSFHPNCTAAPESRPAATAANESVRSAASGASGADTAIAKETPP